MSSRSFLRALAPDFLRRMYGAQRLARSRNYRFLRFAPLGHFYSPIPDIDGLRTDAAALFSQSAKELAGVDINEAGQCELAARFADVYDDLPFPAQKRDDSRYYFENNYFSYGDAVTLYSLMRVLRPKRVVEVGSGFSSGAMLDVNDRFFSGEMSFTFIEPYPERLRSLLRGRDLSSCQILERPVQQAPLELFQSLEKNDFLFVDSSHVAKANSDVVHILFNVLPALTAGVIVHFHDILWPFQYPKAWFEDGRAWNEAYFLRAFLQYNASFQIMYFNSFMAIHHEDFLRTRLPLSMKTPLAKMTPGNSSLWLKKVL